MFKKMLAALAASLALVAYADERPHDPDLAYAVWGQAADVATTAVGITAFGLTEANPLGAGLLILKPAAVAYVAQIEDPVARCEAMRVLGNAGWAPAMANVATMAGASGPAALVVLIGGFLLLQYNTADRCITE